MLAFVKQHKIEVFCFALFIILAILGHATHEITYDEAQAWQIAKTASWKDILLLIPFYEGHPPFWHLLLAGPAKLGLSWHTVYAFLGMGCMIASGLLLFFKAPFPRWVRCLLPFNFFLFYQYGIIVRPYALMMLLMLLLAYFFPQKDQKPGLFVALLSALCMCHVYGIAIAGGITLAWLWQMRAARPWKEYLCSLCKDKRLRYMLGMLALVIVILVDITFQRAGSTFKPMHSKHLWQHLIYLFFAMPADAVITDLNSYIRSYIVLFPWLYLLLTSALGLLLWVVTWLFFPRKKILFLLLPYICLVCVMAHYFSCHHVGLALLLFIWYLWITLAEDAPLTRWPSIIKTLATGLLGLALSVPVVWNLGCLYNDITIKTFTGEDIVSFLKKYHLTDEVIFSTWELSITNAKDNEGHNRPGVVTSPNMQPLALLLNVFLERNIIANFNNGDPDTGYLKNEVLITPEQRVKVFEQWAPKGLPMVTIDMPVLDVVFSSKEDLNHYYRVAYVAPFYHLWKLQKTKDTFYIYLHEKLWSKYGPQILAAQGIRATAPAAQRKPAQNYTITIYR